MPQTRLDYGRTPYNDRLREGMVEYLGEPVAGPPLPGDVVMMRTTGPAHHVGLIVPHWHYGIGLIHADNSAPGEAGGRVVEHGVDVHWQARFLEWFRP